MTVWLVVIGDCESSEVVNVCATKEIAERVLFKARDHLIEGWKHTIEILKLDETDDMYPKMIKALSGNDYKKWDNYPHECPYLYEMEVIQE